MAAFTAYPEKTMLQSPALEKVGELLLHIVWKRASFSGLLGRADGDSIQFVDRAVRLQQHEIDLVCAHTDRMLIAILALP